jgi:hypothetical protein
MTNKPNMAAEPVSQPDTKTVPATPVHNAGKTDTSQAPAAMKPAPLAMPEKKI